MILALSLSLFLSCLLFLFQSWASDLLLEKMRSAQAPAGSQVALSLSLSLSQGHFPSYRQALTSLPNQENQPRESQLEKTGISKIVFKKRKLSSLLLSRRPFSFHSPLARCFC